jgi:hypothetical protein
MQTHNVCKEKVASAPLATPYPSREQTQPASSPTRQRLMIIRIRPYAQQIVHSGRSRDRAGIRSFPISMEHARRPRRTCLSIPRLCRPSSVQGKNETQRCHVVGTLKDGYVRNVPLPRVPQIQSAPKAGIPLPGYLHAPSWIPTLHKLGSILGFSQRLL